jgi:hypothetical protein
MAETMVTREGFLNRGFARVSWGGIIAGAIATIAFGLILVSLGAAIGLTAMNPARGEWGFNSTTGGVATGIWSLCSIVIATFLGAFVASKCSAVDEKNEGGFQGLFVWALALLLMLAWAGWMATRAAETGTQAVGAAAQAAGQVAGQLAGQVAPGQLQNLQQQAQQAMPGGAQLQQQGAQVVATAANAGAAAAWWFLPRWSRRSPATWAGWRAFPRA